MKHAKLALVVVMVIAWLGLASCSDQGTTGGQGQKPTAGKGPSMPSADDTPEETPAPFEIRGVLEQSEAGIMLVSDGEKYVLVGQDLSAMVGQTVTVTGTVEESGGKKTLSVESVDSAP